jgi:hypothetical protein
MFVRTKRHPGSKNSSILICFSVREGHRVYQKVLCNLGKGSTKEELSILKSKAMEKLSYLKSVQPTKKVKETMDTTPALQQINFAEDRNNNETYTLFVGTF